MTHPKTIEAIYTDGACSGNPGPGGWAAVIQFTDGTKHEVGGREAQTTNNRMELQAAIEALKALQELVPSAAAALHTDSEYVKNGITKWVTNWKRKGWKTAQGNTVLNQDLWEVLDRLNSNRIQWHYVRGHSGHPGNDRADAIARAFSLGQAIALTQLAPAQLALNPLETPMTDLPDAADPSPIDSPDGRGRELRVRHLRDVLDTLQIADAIASEGYLITSSELADLMDIHASAVTSRGDQWVWRNWQISRVRREGNQILWQLERIDELS